jgi:hypothetical protein
MSEIEVWKSVVGYEGLYEVSNFGRVKRIAPARGTQVGHIFNPAPDKKGYLRTRLTNVNGQAKTVKVHRIVAQAFHENPLNYPEVNHKDANKRNNYAYNLEWCTGLQNSRHAAENGLLKGSWTGKFGASHNRSISLKAQNIDTGEVKIIQGINEASRILKTNSPAIWRVLKGEYKHTKRWRLEYAQA